MRNIIKLCFIGLLSLLLLTNCGKESHDANTLIVATSADNPSYEFIDKGQISGFDIDLINAIAKKMDKKIIIKNLDFPTLFAALSTKNVDLIIAGLSITAERKANVGFSDIYNVTKIALLFRKNEANATDLHGKIIGAQLGSSWEQTAKELAAKYDVKVHSLANNLMLVEELKSKAIDAVVLEEAQVLKFTENNPELDSIILEEFSSEFAIAFSLDSPLIEQINKALKSLEEDGTLLTLRKKWFPQ